MTRPAPFFVAEDRALDFLNSIASPWGREIEWIGDGHDLLAWLELADLIPASVSARFRKEAGRVELDAVAAQARELREWFRTFVGDHAGGPLQPTALIELGAINRLLERDDSYRQIEVSAQQEIDSPMLGWRQHRRWRSPDTLLLPLAEAIGDLVGRAEFQRVKICDGPTCTLWFHDVSQNHTRRWCSMSVCGNRAKAATHRARKRSSRSELRQTD